MRASVRLIIAEPLGLAFNRNPGPIPSLFQVHSHKKSLKRVASHPIPFWEGLPRVAD